MHRTKVHHAWRPARFVRWPSTIGATFITAGILTLFLGVAAANSQVVRPRPATPRQIIIPVTIVNGADQQTRTVATTSGDIIDVIAGVASPNRQSFVYATRGASMYLSEFWGLGNDRSGRWRVLVNNVEVQDLAVIRVTAKDHVRLERLPL